MNGHPMNHLNLEVMRHGTRRAMVRRHERSTRHSPNRVPHWLALSGQHGAAVNAARIRDLALTLVQIDELPTFVKGNELTAAPKALRTSATGGSGARRPCPAGCAWSATSATTRRTGSADSSRNSRPGPMA